MASQIDRLEQLLAQQEKIVQEAFRDFVRMVNSEHVFAIIADLIEEARIGEAMAIVDSYVRRFADVMPAIQQTVGEQTARELAAIAAPTVLAISFDPTFPRAAAMIRASRLDLITNFSAEQRNATRQALANAFDVGTGGPAATARAFRGSIGLNTEQVKWVASYERRLRNLDRRALGMALRNRRFDRTVENAIELKRPLTEAQIQNMVEKYRLRALMLRSETIARVEAHRAMSAARHEALHQMVEQTGLDPRRIVRTWHATRDERVRDWHASMQDQRVGLDEKFEDGLGNELIWPGDPSAPPETTINCRCTTTYEIKPPLQDLQAR